jgi:hypothetical protein
LLFELKQEVEMMEEVGEKSMWKVQQLKEKQVAVVHLFLQQLVLILK